MLFTYPQLDLFLSTHVSSLLRYQPPDTTASSDKPEQDSAPSNKREMVVVDRGNTSLGQTSSREVVPEWFLEQKRRGKMKQKVDEKEQVKVEDVGVMLERYLRNG